MAGGRVAEDRRLAVTGGLGAAMDGSEEGGQESPPSWRVTGGLRTAMDGSEQNQQEVP